ncbi:hypothetical protein [Bradyrhizobium sp. RT5a]|uniref:hypothetical protein n=1 Tax=Bradyrhizobium sp. RT5a TaxID=3156380 RepID=UPI0033911C25
MHIETKKAPSVSRGLMSLCWRILTAQCLLFAAILAAVPSAAKSAIEDLADIDGVIDRNEAVGLPDPLSASVFRVAGQDAFFVTPTTVTIRTAASGRPEFRLVWNSADFLLQRPEPASLYLVAQASLTDDARAAIEYLRAHYPQAKIGIPRASSAILEPILSAPFVGTTASRIISRPEQNPFRHVFQVRIGLTWLGLRLVLSDQQASLFGLRLQFRVPVSEGVINREEEWRIGQTFSLDCKRSPENFVNLFNGERGCTDVQKLLNLETAIDKCVAEAIQSSQIAPSPELVRLDCVDKLHLVR